MERKKRSAHKIGFSAEILPGARDDEYATVTSIRVAACDSRRMPAWALWVPQ